MSLYRKYRSQKFGDIIGQEHIVQTLKGALSSGRIGHAYIFSGMRGTGKTSIARIFAKAVNCLNLKGGEPCGECGICKETTAGSFLDLIEIDAASNRGIDDIRDLREKIKFSPNVGKYKIYIIDEVHMLTTDAFNALLKTLEEPPLHAIFVLATTEIHKIPATILSRCQRFDFHKINSSQMLDGIKKVAEKENIKIDERSLKKIVSLSEGSLRDALSHLDQVSAFAKGGEIGFTLLEDILGVANEEKLFEFFDIILRKNGNDLISFVNGLVDQGKDLESFIKELIRFARKILILKIGNDDQADILDDAKAREIKERLSLNEIIEIIEILNNVLKNARFSFIPQLSFEVEMMKFFSHQKNEDENRNKKNEIIEKNVTKKISPPESIQKRSDDFVEPISETNNGCEDKKTQFGDVQEFLFKIKEEKVMLYTFIHNCEFSEEEGKVNICAGSSFCFNSISEKNNKMIIDRIAKEVFGDKKTVCILKSDQRNILPKRDLIKDAISVFGGELIE